MNSQWYYVDRNGRQGPFEYDEVLSLLKKNSLALTDLIMKEGEADFIAINKHSDFKNANLGEVMSIKLKDFDNGERNFFVKIGEEGASKEYGPYKINMVIRLFKENRINEKSLVFSKGMKTWKVLGGFLDYEEIFEELPPVMDDEEKRSFERKPIIARLFVTDREQVYEGICRDISEGGMQVLVADYPGSAGDEISLNVHPENSDFHFVASGKIVRFLEADMGFSFEFSDLSEEAVNAIKAYLENE
jgi:hypothetical protein